MVSKKTLPVVAVLLLLAGAVALGMGARQEQGVRVPPGALVDSPNALATGQNPQPTTPQAPELPAADAQVQFLDDFSQALSGWTVANNTDSPASWVTVDGRLEIRGDQNGNPSGEPSILVNRGATLGNGTFQVQVYPTAGEPVGVVFRGSDAGYYRLDLLPNLDGSTKGRAVLNRVAGNGARGEKIAESTTYAGYEFSRWQLVTVTANGSNIAVQVDGQNVIQATDSALTSGWAGIWTMTGYGAQFDNARLTQSR
jgi:hypothetical protein